MAYHCHVNNTSEQVGKKDKLVETRLTSLQCSIQKIALEPLPLKDILQLFISPIQSLKQS